MSIFDLGHYDLSALLMRAHRHRASGELRIMRGERVGALRLHGGAVRATAGRPLAELLGDGPGSLQVLSGRSGGPPEKAWPPGQGAAGLRRGAERRPGPGEVRLWRALPRPTTVAAHLFDQARRAAPPRVWPDHMRVVDAAALAALDLDLSARERALLAGTLRPGELPADDLRLLAALWRLGVVGAVRPQALRTRVGWRPWGRAMLVQQAWVDTWAEQLGGAPTALRVSSRQRSCHWPVQGHPGVRQPRVPLLWLLRARLGAGTFVTLLPPGLADGGPVPGSTVIESHPIRVR